MQNNLFISIPFIFILSLLIGLALYWVGGRISSKGEKNKYKFTPYACGEELPPRKLQIDVERFIIYAVYFLIFDILAFILVTSLNTLGIFPVIYASIVLMSIIILLPLRRRK